MEEVSEFGKVLLFIIGGIVFVCGGLITSWIIRPNRPNHEKLTSYESGEEPMSNAWGHFNIRFFIIALIFILFEVEIVFLFPWATVFGNKAMINQTNGLWGWFSLAEVFLFIGILVLGLAYAWINGFLDWVKPTPEKPVNKSKVPEELYKKVNERYVKKN